MGIHEIWDMICEFEAITKQSGIFESRRKKQKFSWVRSMTENRILDGFYNNTQISQLLSNIEKDIKTGKILATEASDLLIKTYLKDD
jgi:LAO/AO transport system kinase